MKRIAVLGMPNTGKSTFFNRMTGASARVGNWPGVTVDLMSAKILMGADMVEVIDLPGIYDLHGFSDDERVVRHFLENQPVDLITIVLNAVQIERQLGLALQLRELGIPLVLLLNMSDEAKKLGIHIDTQSMAKSLDCPVLLMTAKYGHGYTEAFQQIRHSLAEQHIPETEIGKVDATYQKLSTQEKLKTILALDRALEQRQFEIFKQAVQIPVQLPPSWTTRLDHVLLHPILGLPIFFGVIYLLFQGIFTLGKPIQDVIADGFDALRSGVLEPALHAVSPFWQGLLLDGIYSGLATVAAFVPLIVLFFLFMAIVEDSGYLSRAAFLMDSLMAKMGLDGRSFVMILMGFGCNVPAVMGTRVMRSRALRLLTMLTIPLSLCSARLQIFLFFSAALFTAQQAPLVLFSMYLLSFSATFLTAILFKKEFKNQEPFVLEMPPYRLPTYQQMLTRAWHEVKHFLIRATKFITLGVIAVWFLTHFPTNVPPASEHTLAGMIGGWLSPIFAPLGINEKLTITLIFGFVAKEVVIGAMAVIYGLEGDALAQSIAHQLTWKEAYSFMIFSLLYIPCLATIATLKNESKDGKFTALVMGWSLGLAWVLSFGFYQIVTRFF